MRWEFLLHGKIFLLFLENYINIFSDTIYSFVKQLDPEGILQRTKDAQQSRGEYIVPGPDYIWSIDGYDKLATWGIQIYAAINAYSHNINWIYVGVTNRTTYSVLAQYLKTVKELGYIPDKIRSDRGTETPILAEVHYAIHRMTAPDVPFSDCYYFGTSVHNQRIESWWSQLQKSQLFRWRVCINTLLYNIYLTLYLSRIIFNLYLLKAFLMVQIKIKSPF